MPSELQLEIPAQPNDATCGPTALHGVYRYYGDDISLTQVIDEVEPIETGGTLAVNLARHALARGYGARIYTYNVHIFDPTWFAPGVDISERLRRQADYKTDPKLRAATDAYLDFLAGGGRLLFEELGPDLIRRHLREGHPVLTGLSATYLYGSMREFGEEGLTDDDVRGVPTGHFVVLYGYRPGAREVLVADPLGDNPRYGEHYYAVGVDRLLGAIFLGILTYDANLLVLEPVHRRPGS